MESVLRPRDIQARIRAGESPEDVATAAQSSVESIMTYANPVLAERAHVAQTAQRASVRRRTDIAGSARTLGESAATFFSVHALSDEDVAWDAWRQADGRWALVAVYSVDGRPRRAEFTHDLPGKYVLAENDEARLLTGEMRDPGTLPGARSGHAPPAGRRLSAVDAPGPLPGHQDELPLGDDAIELVREPATDPVSEQGESVEQEEPELDQPLLEEPPARPKPKRKGRSTIPSWDEIMFGDQPGE